LAVQLISLIAITVTELLGRKRLGKMFNKACRYGVIIINIKNELNVEWEEVMMNKENPEILAT
jgi:hypothetical protein